MAVTGKTGADALNNWLKKSQGTLKRYRAKMSIVIAAATIAGAITGPEAALIIAYIDAMDAAAAALQKLADYSGF